MKTINNNIIPCTASAQISESHNKQTSSHSFFLSKKTKPSRRKPADPGWVAPMPLPA